MRRHDPDRFLTALFAPEARRETLFVLYAFNHELARAREAASQPTVALIRLHWWREVVEGVEKRHEVATPLRRAIAAGELAAEDLLAMLDGREIEADPSIPTLDAWHGYLLATGGSVARAAGRLLGAPAQALDGLTALGGAYAAAGVIRSVKALAARGRCLLPEDVLGRYGLTPEAVIERQAQPRVLQVQAELAAQGLQLLRRGRATRLPRTCLAAALPAVLARRDLRRPDRSGPRGLGDRLALTLAGLTGRL